MREFSELELGELKAAVDGPVYVRGEAGYADELGGFNTLSPNNPDLVVGVASEADVQAAVRWAVAHGVTVHPQATGHGAYRKLDHGMVLRTGRLDSLSIDREAQTFTIGAGMPWFKILPELHRAGLGAVTGSAKTVGAVGLMLGGGIGPVGRTFGMAADWVRGFRVVDATGEVLVVNPESHGELYWALRGGKVGLGVVTEMTVQALPMPFVYGGGIYYPESEMPRLFHAWLDWIEGLPESVSTSVAVFRLPPELPEPLGGRTWFHFRYAYAEPGVDPELVRERGEALLAPWREIAGPGEVDMIELLPSDRVGEIHQEPEGPVPLWEYGDYLDPIDHDFVDTVLSFVGPGIDAPLANVEVRYHSGAYARDPEVPSAIGGRKQPFTLLVLGHPDGTQESWDHVESVGYGLRDAVQPWSGAEVNYNWANHPSAEVFENRLWSPEVRDRLKRIRAEFDPTGVFEFGN